MLDVQSIEPDSVWVRTNPVWSYREYRRRQSEAGLDSRTLQMKLADWINRAQEQGVRFPRNLWEGTFCHCPAPEWKQPDAPPRIVGLLRASGASLRQAEGFVTPIQARRSNYGWQVSDGLPFKVGHIQDALRKLVRSSGMSVASVIPESHPFELSDSLGQAASGSSMNIAGLLAVIDAWNDYQGTEKDLLRSACSLVKPTETELTAVGSIEEKLTAFERELGCGSLVVCTDEAAATFDLERRFQNVWTVSDFGGLAEKLGAAGLLRPLFRRQPLTVRCVDEAGRILDRLRSTEGTKAALDFSRRLNRAAIEGEVESLRVRQRAGEALEDFNRHIGNFADAVKYSREAVEAVESLGTNASFQEMVEAKVRLASAMYDAHQFADAIEMLKELLDESTKHPRLLNAECRIMLKNTFARLLVATAVDGWEEQFRQSFELQEIVDPTNIGRTRCYLVHGLLRSERTGDAQTELAWYDEHRVDAFTASFVKYYRADLYRRDPSVGEAFRQDGPLERTGRGHAFGFYLQATARQLDRTDDDRKERFRRAINVFEVEIGEHTHQNILRLFGLFLKLASDEEEYPRIREEVEQFFDDEPTGALRRWYAEALQRDPEGAEELLRRVPYF
ncbi:MAG: hypothetical protein WD049_05840 [Candidatus Paceibacterota bacterium]